MYFRARYYNSQLGQFISRDPLGYVDGMSQYRAYFVPRAMDPSGMASRAQVEDGTLQYSCNCGWIDWSHAGKEVIVAGKEVLDVEFADVWKEIQGATNQMGTGTRVVCYSQYQTKWGAATGFKKCYWIKEGMTAFQQERVAWNIFREVSENFEEHQSWVGLPGNDSGFSPEDLISNLLLFQRVTNGVTRDEIKKLCGVIETKQDNYDLYDAFDWSRRAVRRDGPGVGSPWKALTFSSCNQCPPGRPTFPDKLSPPGGGGNYEGSLYGDVDEGASFFETPPAPDIDLGSPFRH